MRNILLFLFLLLPSSYVHASELKTDVHQTVQAQVLEIISEDSKLIPGTDTKGQVQSLKAKILEGESKDKEVQVDNDRSMLEKGDIFYLQITSYPDGAVTYFVSEPYRLKTLAIITLLFLVLVAVFGGVQGIRGLLSLIGSLFIIFYVFLPSLLTGFSPIFLSIIISSLIIIVGSYITHGFNKTTSSAVIGMLITVTVTGLLAMYSVYATRLSGFASEEVVYLNFNTQGTLDMSGLLLGGIMIGLLGVLYDIAIGQAITVEELIKAAPSMSKKKLFERANRVGREHIGALINTLAIAYVGAALPLLLLFYSSSTSSVLSIINREDFSTEIVRTLVGSIGLVLAVPITSVISVFMLKKGKDSSDPVDESKIPHLHGCGHIHH
jgi:uncharacterized membrane protein